LKYTWVARPWVVQNIKYKVARRWAILVFSAVNVGKIPIVTLVHGECIMNMPLS